MHKQIGRAKLHEKDLAEHARVSLIKRLERAIELVRLNAPEIIIDMHLYLVNQSAAALLGDYNLRAEAEKRQRRIALDMGRCAHCFAVREKSGEEFCSACIAEFDKMNAEVDAENATLCITCGHPRGDHYEYTLNGNEQTRCMSCDPHTGKRGVGVNHAMTAGSEEERMYRFADHDFDPMLPLA